MPAELNGPLKLTFPKPVLNGPGSLLKEAVRFYFRHFGLIAKYVLVVFLPVFVLKNYLVLTFSLQEHKFWNFVVSADVINLGSSLFVPALLFALIRTQQNEAIPSMGESLAFGFSRFLRVFGWRCVVGIATILGLVLFVVPGIVVALWYSLVTVVLIIEGRDCGDPLARSKALMEGNTATLFWALLASGLVYLAAMLLFGFMLGIGIAIAGWSMPLPFAQNWVFLTLIDGLNTQLTCLFSIMFLVAYRAWSPDSAQAVKVLKARKRSTVKFAIGKTRPMKRGAKKSAGTVKKRKSARR